MANGGDPDEEILRSSKLSRRNSRRIKDGKYNFTTIIGLREVVINMILIFLMPLLNIMFASNKNRTFYSLMITQTLP